MAYTRVNWTPTIPLSDTNLNKMDEGIRIATNVLVENSINATHLNFNYAETEEFDNTPIALGSQQLLTLPLDNSYKYCLIGLSRISAGMPIYLADMDFGWNNTVGSGQKRLYFELYHSGGSKLFEIITSSFTSAFMRTNFINIIKLSDYTGVTSMCFWCVNPESDVNLKIKLYGKIWACAT